MSNILKEISWKEIQKLTVDKDEQEFSLTTMREDDFVTCFCSDNNMLTQLKNIMKQNPNDYKCFIKYVHPDGRIGGYEFKFPKRYLKFLVRDRQYNMSQEQKEASKERMLKAREAKASK